MTPQARTIAEEMTEQRLKEVKALIKDSDYDSCDSSHCQEVHDYLVTGIGVLVLNASKKAQPFWQEWANRAPYAFALLVAFLVYLYIQVTGKFPVIPGGVAEVVAEEIVEVAEVL